MRSILKVNWDSNLPIYAISKAELRKEGICCLLIEDEEFDKIQPLIEYEIEKSNS